MEEKREALDPVTTIVLSVFLRRLLYAAIAGAAAAATAMLSGCQSMQPGSKIGENSIPGIEAAVRVAHGDQINEPGWFVPDKNYSKPIKILPKPETQPLPPSPSTSANNPTQSASPTNSQFAPEPKPTGNTSHNGTTDPTIWRSRAESMSSNTRASQSEFVFFPPLQSLLDSERNTSDLADIGAEPGCKH